MLLQSIGGSSPVRLFPFASSTCAQGSSALRWCQLQPALTVRACRPPIMASGTGPEKLLPITRSSMRVAAGMRASSVPLM